MKKSWGLTGKILTDEKTIESRWYLSKRLPWNRIKVGETVYFKDSGGPVRLRATVEKALQFDNLTSKKVGEILGRYGQADGIGPKEIPDYFNRFKNKKYCLLIFLKNPESVEPFFINKTGFGSMSAWLAVSDILKIKKN